MVQGPVIKHKASWVQICKVMNMFWWRTKVNFCQLVKFESLKLWGCLMPPLIWLIMRAESPKTLRNLILKSIAARRPMMHASYSAMLLVQLKQSGGKRSMRAFRRYDHSANAITQSVRSSIKVHRPSGSFLRSFIRSRFFTIGPQHDVLIRELVDTRYYTHWGLFSWNILVAS